MAIAAYDVPALVNLARQAEGLIIMPFAVGDVVIEGETLLTVYGGRLEFSQPALSRAVQRSRNAPLSKTSVRSSSFSGYRHKGTVPSRQRSHHCCPGAKPN